jgi:hypothetical protein
MNLGLIAGGVISCTRCLNGAGIECQSLQIEAFHSEVSFGQSYRSNSRKTVVAIKLILMNFLAAIRYRSIQIYLGFPAVAGISQDCVANVF